jgi:hypothetical protein
MRIRVGSFCGGYRRETVMGTDLVESIIEIVRDMPYSQGVTRGIAAVVPPSS